MMGFLYMIPSSEIHLSKCRYLLTEQSRLRSVNDIMPMIGARFYTQLDASQMRNDVIEEDLAKVSNVLYSCSAASSVIVVDSERNDITVCLST